MNTKNIIVLMFLILFAAGASAQVYHYNAGIITDSAGIITIKKPLRMMNINQDFGYGSSLWNFRLENDEGTITWRANNDRDLMVYDDDGHIWDFTGTVKINGVTISPGGGDAYLTNRQTFTARNIFSDTLKADALSLMEQVRIADWFQVNGDVISNFMFLKGSRTFTGTIDNYGFVIKTADTNRIEIDSLGYVTINKRLSVGEYVIATDSVKSEQFSAGDIYFNNNGSGIYWRQYSSYINEDINTLKYSSNMHQFITKNSHSTIAELDSAAGMNLLYGSYTGNGSGLTNVDAATLKGQDTTNYAHTTTGTTETFLSKIIFSALVTFQTTSPVFNIAAVFNVLQDFANGITTTTITASSTATFNGDLVPTWVKNNSSVSAYQYEKTKIIGMKLSASLAVTTTAAHGITDWHTVKSYDVSVHDDSSNTVIHPNTYSNDISSSGKLYTICWVDSLNCNLRVPATGVNLTSDSAFFTIRYVDFNR